MNSFLSTLTPEQLASLGGGILGYVREIGSGDAKALLGGVVKLPNTLQLFCLYNADGTPISISASKEAAFGSALEHDLTPASVH